MARATRTPAKTRGATGPRRYEHGQDAVARPEIGAAPRFILPEDRGVGQFAPRAAGDA
jgi:hypothetical protein